MIVLSKKSVHCFEDYNGFSPPFLDLANVICHLGLRDFFRILLRVFHVGIWSCRPLSRLDLVLVHLLLVELRSQLLFVYGQRQVEALSILPKVVASTYCGSILQIGYHSHG